MFVFDLLCITSCPFNFAIILKRKRKFVALLLLSSRCIVTLNVLWLFLTVPWVGLQCVIVVFPDHTHLLFYSTYFRKMNSLNLDQALALGPNCLQIPDRSPNCLHIERR